MSTTTRRAKLRHDALLLGTLGQDSANAVHRGPIGSDPPDEADEGRQSARPSVGQPVIERGQVAYHAGGDGSAGPG
jgi:hypothetical protein